MKLIPESRVVRKLILVVCRSVDFRWASDPWYDPCMIDNGEQPVRPHGTGFYFGVAVLALLAGSMFTWGAFAPSGTPFAWRLVRIGVAIIFLFGAVQPFERLFRPERAQDRSSALSSSTRVRLRTVCRSVLAVSITAVAIATLLRLAGGQYERDFATDLQILSAVLLFAGYCVADVCGERFFAVFRTTEP